MINILDLVEQDGIHLKRVSNFHGGEYAGPCLLCGGRDRFRVWPEEGQSGKWWCRGCNSGGDPIQYLRDIRNMNYFEACDFLGRDPGETDKGSQSARKSEWTPREIIPPVDMWIRKTTALVDWCQEQLWSEQCRNILEWLKDERGLSEEIIKNFRLGWNPQDLWRERIDWGLSEEIKDNGRPKKLWLPAGLVIPCYSLDGNLQRARIRRQDPEADPRYCILSGSGTGPMILGKNRKIFVIVESELDGILLHQEIGDMAVGVIALGSAQSRPDNVTADILKNTELILIALDGDDPGAKEAWHWWPEHFSQAKRHPPIDGKDPGEMWKNGINLSDWVDVGIEEESEPKQEATMVAQGQSEQLPGTIQDSAELISDSIKYLAGINEDLTGWSLWKRIEDGREHRWATDPGGAIRWERWYELEPRVMI